MLLNKQAYMQKRGSSNKKMQHRRVITETDLDPHGQPTNNRDPTKTERIVSKPRFIDVYSKYVNKNGPEQKKLLRAGEHRQMMGNGEQHKQMGDGEQNRQVGNRQQYRQQTNGDQHRQVVEERPLKTEANEVISNINSIVGSQTQRSKTPGGKYEMEGVAGKGTFGVVYYGRNRLTGEKIAIKKVFQDKKYKNREHTILKMLSHPNNLSLLDSFISHEGKDEYLNIVMDYFPDNLYQLVKKKDVTPILTKLYAYQLFRALNYLTMLSIAHRDIKPQNILVDKHSNLTVITDYGSAKQLVKNEANLAYICSRCYRAPELIFGATNYTTQIDMWSMGCVLVEMVNGTPPFMGDSQIDQLIEIIKVLGTPSKGDVEEMNKNYDMREYSKFPKIKVNPWKNILKTRDPLLIDLVTRVLQYSPKKRLTPAEALYHEYFDELRDHGRHQEMLFRVKAIPELFDFSQEEAKFMAQETGRKVEVMGAVGPVGSKKHPSLNAMTRPTSSTGYTRRTILSTKAL